MPYRIMNERGIKFKKLYFEKGKSSDVYPIVKGKIFDFASKSYAIENSRYFK